GAHSPLVGISIHKAYRLFGHGIPLLPGLANGERLSRIGASDTSVTRLRLSQFAFPRNALMLFICTFNAISKLAPIMGELFGHFVNAAWHIATDCGPCGSRSPRHGIYAASRSTLKNGRERGAGCP